ncbi:unnamed protein product [Moneuplotes crassus]|uniref:CRAL-TRIO domain-containing protein n=1 Tax=Euplotes crassus TaxID=5936 RepID=A0AAD1UNX8_EUPCR|nr:unnamed protein product [Moneuplotes crassus]
MGWFSSSKKEEKSGFMDDMSEEQEQTLEEFKKIIAEESLTEDSRYDDYYLLRFLRARKFDIEKTMVMFKKFLEWRVEHRTDEAMVIYKCPNVEKAREIYPHGYHGTDLEGRPFYIDQPCNFHIDDLLKIVSKEELYVYYVREYEKLIHVRFPACSAASEKKIEQSFSLLNLKGFSMGKLKEKSRNFIKLAIDIGSDNYPEIMYKMFIVNTSFVFKGAWAIISPFLDAKTKKKISIHGSSFQKELFKYVDPSNVPESLGGECTCSHTEGGCYFSDVGPWNEYPADEFGEAAKQAILEEEKNEIAATEGLAPPPPPSSGNVEEVTEQMANLEVQPAVPTELAAPPPPSES